MRLRALYFVAIIGFICVIGFAFRDWFAAAEVGQKKIPEMKTELTTISLLGTDRVVDTFTSYKSDHAVVGRAISSSQSWEVTQKYYIAEMERLGWSQFASADVFEWQQDRGGKIVRFRKNSLVASLYYAGEQSASPWKYTIDISSGLY